MSICLPHRPGRYPPGWHDDADSLRRDLHAMSKRLLEFKRRWSNRMGRHEDVAGQAVALAWLLRLYCRQLADPLRDQGGGRGSTWLARSLNGAVEELYSFPPTASHAGRCLCTLVAMVLGILHGVSVKHNL